MNMLGLFLLIVLAVPITIMILSAFGLIASTMKNWLTYWVIFATITALILVFPQTWKFIMGVGFVFATVFALGVDSNGTERDTK